MKFFISYIREKKFTYITIAACILIFIIVFALYHIQIKAAAYPAGLCAAVVILFSVFDFAEFRKKHMAIEYAAQINTDLTEKLNIYDTQTDRDYQNLIRVINEQKKRIIEADDCRMKDIINYYTIWVHQIKTPIAAMKLTLQNEDTGLSRKLREDLFRIEQYADMVLTYIRLDSETTDFVFREYDMDSIIKNCIRKFAGQFIGKGIGIDFHPSGMKAVTDEKWLSFVIEQVLSNAVKYTHKGTVSIYIEEPGKLCIKDTGIGIRSEDIPRIFEQGYTGCNGRTDNRASGIGLYLCRRICRGLGYEIYAESEEGKGTLIGIDFSRKQTMYE